MYDCRLASIQCYAFHTHTSWPNINLTDFIIKIKFYWDLDKFLIGFSGPCLRQYLFSSFLGNRNHTTVTQSVNKNAEAITKEMTSDR